MSKEQIAFSGFFPTFPYWKINEKYDTIFRWLPKLRAVNTMKFSIPIQTEQIKHSVSIP